MKRAKVIGPGRSISPRIRSTRSGRSRPIQVRGRDPSQLRSVVHAGGSCRRGPSASRRPGPTSVWPPSTIGTGAAAAAAVSSRSHGSSTRSCSRRSDAKRSSGGGQRPLVGAEAMGEQHPAVDQRRRRPVRRSARPSEAGPSRSSSAPRTDAGGLPSDGEAAAGSSIAASEDARSPRSSTSALIRAAGSARARRASRPTSVRRRAAPRARSAAHGRRVVRGAPRTGATIEPGRRRDACRPRAGRYPAARRRRPRAASVRRSATG